MPTWLRPSMWTWFWRTLSWRRRDAIFWLTIGALGLAGLSSENGSRLVLLHTNDIHGHLTAWRGWEGDLKDRQIGGLDRLTAEVLQIRKDNQGRSLLLDAGDCWGDTMIADRTKGSALVAALNHLDYDASRQSAGLGRASTTDAANPVCAAFL